MEFIGKRFVLEVHVGEGLFWGRFILDEVYVREKVYFG